MHQINESGPELFHPLKNPDVLDQSLLSQLRANEDDQKQIDLLTKLTDFVLGTKSGGGGSGGSSGGGFSLGSGYSDKKGAVYEEYGWEGHSSNFGPKGNRLGEGYGVGLGIAEQASVGAHFGDTVKIHFADGTEMVRKINETSARAHGVEFFTNTRGEYDKHGAATVTKMAAGGFISGPTLALLGDNASGKEAVIPLDRGGKSFIGGHSSRSFSPNISINITRACL
jgi:hypothetical protein